MTEYKDSQGNQLTEITNKTDYDLYLAQAEKAYNNEDSDMSYLPFAKDFTPPLYDTQIFDSGHIRRDSHGVYSDPRVSCISLILKNTLCETFKNGDSEHISRLIDDFYNCAHNKSATKFYNKIIDAAISKNSNSDWMEKLTPTAKLILLRKNPSCVRDITLDTSACSRKNYDGRLHAAAVSFMEGRDNLPIRNNHQLYRHDKQWEDEAQALNVLAEYRQDDIAKYFCHLVENIDSDRGERQEHQVKQLLNLLQKDWLIADLRKNFARDNDSVKRFFENIPDTESRKDFLFNFLYKVKLEYEPRYNSPQDVKEAAAKARVYRHTDELKKAKDQNLSQDEIRSIAHHRPEFLESAKNLSADAKRNILDYCCENSNNKHPITATRAVSLTIDILSLDEKGFIPYVAPEKIADYLKLAQGMSAPVADMKKLFKALQPHMDYYNKQKSADEETITRYAQCKANLEVANDRTKISLDANNAFAKILDIKNKMINIRDAKDKAELDKTIDNFYQDVLAGRDVQLKIKPKGFLGFTSANEKELQKKAKELSDNITEIRKNPASFDILKAIGGHINNETAGNVYRHYRECVDEEYELQNEFRKFFDIDGKKKELKSFKILNDTYDNVKQATETKEADLKTRGRIELGMKLDGQEFSGEPLEGLVNEDKMAQATYKKKIDKLKAKIEASAKKHLEEQTGETPQKDKHCLRKGKAVEDAAKQGKTVNPSKALKNMKLLKEYKGVVKN